jgi:PHD/YefM family antitoxin component YafN of YafNO toxin-antitoxin module
MIKKIKIADAQTDLPSLVKSVTEDNKIYAIENQEDSVILISQKNYESLQETIELLSIPDLRESLQLWLFVTWYGSIGRHKSTKSLSGKRLN